MIRTPQTTERFWKIDLKIKAAFHRSLKNWFLTHRRELPWRDPRTPYAVVVSEFMLQQTQVKTVIPYFNRWMLSYPDWDRLAQATELSVLKSWEGLGYYSRARNLHRLAKTIVDDLEGKVPSSLEELEKLPGIGRYTAGAIASLAFHQKASLVDGNVIRLFSRIFACAQNVAQPKVIAEFWQLAEALLPKSDFGIHNESLMELGALLCTPKNPQCSICPLRSICIGKESPERYPYKEKAASEKREEKIAVVKNKNKYRLVQGTKRQRGFWLFPSFNSQLMNWNKTLGTLNYGFTKYRITMNYGECLFKEKATVPGKWMSLKEIETLPLPQAHRKIAKGL